MFNQDQDGQNPDDTQEPTPMPSTPNPGTTSLYEAVASIYRTALGREGTPQEINGWIQGKTPNDLGAIQQAIYGSPEALAYGGSNQTTTTPAPGPLAPDAQGPGPAPAPAPAPTATATPAPTFTPPTYTPPPAFNYADFVAPDPNQLNSDPLFKFTMQREQDAIARRSAANGGLFTGGTYDALMRNAADITSAGYQHLYDRDLNTYQTNRGNAVQNYNTNYGTQYTDPYKYAYQGSQDAFNSQIHNFDQGRSYDWARTLFGEQQANDAFDRKYRIYSSL